MITVTRFNSIQEFAINADFIETVEETPDTVITLTSGKKYLVQEKAAEVIKRMINYQRMVRDKDFNVE